jgi:NodT family efflux transporter outer membrane factor (OMF) lipoprotein
MNAIDKSNAFHRHRAWLAGLAALALAACADMHGLAPGEAPHDTAALAASRTLAKAPVAADAWPANDWWKAYGDPQLDALMDEALAGSPSLAVAAARTRKALAAAQVTDSARYPHVNGNASVTRERFSENGLFPPPLGGSWQTDTELALSFDWELDVWGKNRAAYESALGAARAAEVDAAAARLALTTAIAQAYAELRHAFERRDVAASTLKDREQILTLTRDRVAAGLDSRVELKQAEAALPATREEIAGWDERIALLRNELAALAGAGPDRGLAIARPVAAVKAVALPSTVPADLLGRRPDLVAQKLRIEAAHAAIDSAKAEFYPNINLAALVGLSTLGGNPFLAANRAFSAAPAVTLPIFDAGRLRGNLAGKDADYDVAVAQYNQMIADALHDVVDQLASWRVVEVQRAEQRSALATAREAYELALVRYRGGLGNYLQVLSVEQPMLVQEGLAADLDARELALSIHLVRALGGGFAPPLALAANCVADPVGGDASQATPCAGAATRKGVTQ